MILRQRPRRTGARTGLTRATAFVAAATAVLVGLAAQPVAAAPAAEGAAGTDQTKVSPALRTELASSGTTDFMVYLKERADLSAASSANPDARATGVFRRLTETATRTQRDLRAELDERKVPYQAFWIANALKVTGDRALVDAIASSDAVERVEESRSYPLITPTEQAAADVTPQATEWGVASVKAPQVWSEFGVRGEGIVVANIDSGVQHDHPALVASYRGTGADGAVDHNYNWFDPTGLCAGGTPCDNNGHGTHTMGTMVGDDGAGNQIGVAPGARWMAAKGCEGQGCSDAGLLAAGQFVLAPTDLAGNNPRPDLHADVVNNSWGGGRGNLWYKQIVDSWVAAGIFPSFANGNSGPSCGTANSPGDYPNSYAVGGYDINNNIYTSSSRGSSAVDGGTKPDISGPAVNVRSSLPGNAYGTATGTSMAAPHLSAAVALVWSAAPTVRGDIAATRELLDTTAIDVDSTGCGGTVEDNNNFGEGRLDALEAVTQAPRGETGTVVGTVTAADTGQPISGAAVSYGDRQTTAGTDGSYRLRLAVGETELTASAYGYHPATATVTVADGETVTEDFALASAEAVTVTGTVTDGSGHGWPLYAKVSVAGRPGAPVHTDPVTGEYSVDLPANATYQLTTTPAYPSYETVTTEVTVGAEGATADVAIGVDESCTAAGYSINYGDPVITESFDDASAPGGWSVVNNTEHGGWVFDEPLRGNLTGGAGSFAIADSDSAGSGTSLDTELVTPTLDFSSIPFPYLRYRSDYRGFGNGYADVDLSTDGGATWTTLTHWTTTSRRGPVVEELALPGAGGSDEVLVRFHYAGSFAWWWQLDDIEISNRACEPVPGGLVVGTTNDANTGAGLNGVTVSSVADPADKAVSAATPDDPALGDGFYWLFTDQVGASEFTATRSSYQTATATVTVAADDATEADFTLAAGRLTMTPATLAANQQYGKSRSTNVTIRNTGGAPATVEVLERSGDFTILGRTGAPLVENWVKGVSAGMSGQPVAGGVPTAGSSAGPAAADAWDSIADLPVDLYDNALATIGGKVYSVGGGTDPEHESRAWVYEPAEESWTALPNLPTGRARPSAVGIDGKVYVFGGWAASGTPVATVDVFDPTAGTWSTLAGTNPKAAAAAGTAYAGGKVHLVGGCLDSSCTESAEVAVFDPASGTFDEVAAYPNPVSWVSCGGIAAKVYCGGGISADVAMTDAWVYDPAADGWAALPDLPLDMWGSGYATASGLLVINGGVTNNFSTVTNRTIGYDPAAGAWIDLPNSQVATYRGATACGVYKAGGMTSPWVGTPDAEVLGGLDGCGGGAGDVPWLSTSESSFTLAPGASKTVRVTMTATAEAGVDQPGTYTAGLTLVSDTPYQAPETDVTMSVTPLNSWGKIQGRATTEPCSGSPAGVTATIRVVNVADPSVSYALVADSSGAYAYWLPRGRYDVIVAKDGWLPETLRHRVEPGITATLDFGLAPLVPCGTRASGI